MQAALRRDRWAIGVNLCAVAAYLLISSLQWINPFLPLADRSVGPGAGLAFALLTFPILGAATAFDLGWLGWRVFWRQPSQGQGFWLLLLAFVGAWAVAHIVNLFMLGDL